MQGILIESECRSFVLNVSPCVRMRPTTMSILGQSKLDLFPTVLKDFPVGDNFISVELKDKGSKQAFRFRTDLSQAHLTQHPRNYNSHVFFHSL